MMKFKSMSWEECRGGGGSRNVFFVLFPEEID